MADNKDKKTPREIRPAGKQMADSSPNPHGENKVIEMPIRTEQKRETRGQNVAHTPSTVGGRLNPSVAHDLQPRAGASPNKPLQDKSPQDKRQRKSIASGAPLDKDISEKEA
jgi:hypothetical protein